MQLEPVVMRGEKAGELLELARALAASAEGMTLDEMAAFSKVKRRTVERRRDAIEAVFGPLDQLKDGRQIRFRMNGRGLGSFAVAPTSEEIAELENAARAFEGARDRGRAEILHSLRRKILANLRDAERLRLCTDIDARLRAEAMARQVGPRPYADPKILATLRQALLAGLMVRFLYGDEKRSASRWRKVIPYGLLLGPRYYLVANQKSYRDPMLFRLDRIQEIEIMNEPGAPPEGFDLEEYAARSFGVFQEEPLDIVLRFAPSAAPDARNYLFHPTQELIEEPDGSLTIRFHAGGLLQIVHHLMTWGTSVTIIAPDVLKNLMRQQVDALHEHYHSRKRASAAFR
jgi:predicted DNA-binding transcriptional regulator YafY